MYTQYIQDQGVVAGNKSKSKGNSKSNKLTSKSDFSFQITFASKRKLQGVKLKKAMDDFYGYSPSTTKTIKLEPDKLPDMKDVDDGSTQYPLSTYVYKVFNDIEYRGKVQEYDPHKKLYFIVYKVRNYCMANVKQYPKRKQWRKRKSIALTNLMQKYTPTEADSDEHIPSLSVKDIRAIASIRFTDMDMTEDAIPSE